MSETTVFDQSPGAKTHAVFHTTHWSVILASAQGGEALESLCQAYWYPVYAFLRRKGIPPADAEDFTQGFFAQFLERGTVGLADRERGRFRSFLLACLNHYVSDQRDKERALRRGGGHIRVNIDLTGADEHYALETAHHETPERLFERRWALTILERGLKKLEQEQIAAGREREFAVLRTFLTDTTGQADYQEVSRQTGLSPNAVGVAVHRLRRRYHECVREEVSMTVATAAEVEAEMAHLLSVFSL